MITAGSFRTVRHNSDRTGPGVIDPSITSEIADVHARLDTLERGGDRVDELEDRLDFAERLLARANQSDSAVREP